MEGVFDRPKASAEAAEAAEAAELLRGARDLHPPDHKNDDFVLPRMDHSASSDDRVQFIYGFCGFCGFRWVYRDACADGHH